MKETVLDIAGRFILPHGELQVCPYGNGHINDTYCVSVCAQGQARRFILQRVNRYVFVRPIEVIENIERVTAFLRERIREEGGDARRGTLELIEGRDGRHFVLDESGDLWRMYWFIEGTVSVDLPDSPELMRLSGEAFGRFQRQLGQFPADSLHETIRDFHNTPMRYAQLMEAARRNAAGRLGEVQAELAFIAERERDTRALTEALAAGEIPLRVTHNDTKLNNVLLDAETGKGVCVIDLDTVMPGLAAYDFGDCIRSGANTAAEDERDLSKVELSLPMVSAFAKGFLQEAGNTLTRREIELLPMGAKLMTLECGMRFLSDYLDGDRYFKVHREGQNLDRARTQLALVAQMEAQWEQMTREIVRA